MLVSLVLPAMLAASPPLFLQRDDGQVAYELWGSSGPWVVCVPGLGDTRAQYRLLAPRLVEAGYRVAVMDLRGLGDSSAAFARYTPDAVGTDVVALMVELGVERAVLVGQSMAAAAVVWAAAERPDLVDALVLMGPFVRDVPTPFYVRPLMDFLFAPPWGPRAWSWYYGTLYPQRQPADLGNHRAMLTRNLNQPGRQAALLSMLHASKKACSDRLHQVKAPTLVVMGTEDPDFAKPEEEARWVSSHLKGTVTMIPGAGHYPNVDSVEETAAAMAAFLRKERHGS